MTQPTLFDLTDAPQYDNNPSPPPVEARARRSDPQSSKEAAERMNKSGATDEQSQRILAVVSQGGGWTAWEIAKAAKFPSNVEVSRRLSGIKEIKRSDASLDRPCRVTKRKCSTYWLKSYFDGGDE